MCTHGSVHRITESYSTLHPWVVLQCVSWPIASRLSTGKYNKKILRPASARPFRPIALALLIDGILGWHFCYCCQKLPASPLFKPWLIYDVMKYVLWTFLWEMFHVFSSEQCLANSHFCNFNVCVFAFSFLKLFVRCSPLHSNEKSCAFVAGCYRWPCAAACFLPERFRRHCHQHKTCRWLLAMA